MAKIKTKYSAFGLGGLLQLIGVICLFFFPFGTLVGILLIIFGQVKSKSVICSDCGNPVVKTAKICPVCKADFI